MNFLQQLQARLQERISARAATKIEMDTVLVTPVAEARNLTDAEEAKFTEIRARLALFDEKNPQAEKYDESVAFLEGRVADLVALDTRTAELAAIVPPTVMQNIQVRSEQRTYGPHSDPKGAGFLRDVALRHLGDHGAAERLGRHMAEERVERRGKEIREVGGHTEARAVGMAAFAGLVVPQYLTDLVAPNAAAGRPTANICNRHDLPAIGNTVNISRITTATSAGVQASENTAVSETNIDDTLLTENVFTVAGQQTMSRQSIERGVGTEEITVQDLIRRYHTNLDSKLLNDATTGLTNVAQNIAYTDGTPTAAELYPKLLNAQSNLEAVMLDQGIGTEYAIMHSRRWAWMQSQVSSTWPFITQPGQPVQAGGVALQVGYGQGVRGVLPNGTGVITDNSIGTTLGAGTEDEIYIVNAAELHLWEEPNAPVYIRAEQPALATLGVLLVVYGYAAYSFRRYTNGMQKISGTGLIAPTF